MAAFLLPAAQAQYQIPPGSIVPPGSLVGTVVPAPPSGITVSPAAGTYTGAQTITIGCPSGQSCFYTTDGSPATPASTQYTGPFTLSASATVNITAVATTEIHQSVQATNTNWKICTPSGGNAGTPTSTACGGVGSTQPSTWSYSWGSTMSQSVSTTASSGETQILAVYSGPGNDASTFIAQHKVFQPTVGNGSIANNEIDMWENDNTRNRLHMFGWQCNQQPGNPAYGLWQYDNEQGSWQTTSISCTSSFTGTTTIDLVGHWTNGDTGCGGLGCDYFDYVVVNGTKYTLGYSVESDTESPAWSSVCGNQDQIDLTNTATSGTNPTTGGRTVTADNVTCGTGSATATSASYTIQ